MEAGSAVCLPTDLGALAERKGVVIMKWRNFIIKFLNKVIIILSMVAIILLIGKINIYPLG